MTVRKLGVTRLHQTQEWEEPVKISPAIDEPVAIPRTGGGPCRAWPLPADSSCASEARVLIAGMLGALRVPRSTIADVQLMISELATNALQHATGHGPHELWLCPPGAHWPAGHAAASCGGCPWKRFGSTGRLVCGVFDGLAGTRLPEYSWTSGDCGRGLTIVAELSQGRWGLRSARSRLRPALPGKIVWFAVPASIPEAP